MLLAFAAFAAFFVEINGNDGNDSEGGNSGGGGNMDDMDMMWYEDEGGFGDASTMDFLQHRCYNWPFDKPMSGGDSSKLVLRQDIKDKGYKAHKAPEISGEAYGEVDLDLLIEELLPLDDQVCKFDL